MHDLTPTIVTGLWSHLSGVYGTTVVPKDSAPEMVAVGKLLHALGIQDEKKFLSNYTTTIGKRIYTPFQVGIADPIWSLEAQVAVCAHESQHIVQNKKDGWLYSMRYLLSSRARALYEIEAYRATLEMHWFLSGSMPDPERYATGLSSYGCTASDIEVARRTVDMYAVDVRNGAVFTEAAKTAIEFLKCNVSTN